MAIVSTRKFCKDCGQNKLFEKQGPSHILHLILSVITVGLWIPIWILCVVLNAFRPYRCTNCGKGAL